MGCQFHAILICYLDVKLFPQVYSQFSSRTKVVVTTGQDRRIFYDMESFEHGFLLLYSVEEDGVFTYRMA